MSTLEILSLLFLTAALFGLVSARWLRVPITIGTMMLTVLVSATLMLISSRVSGIHDWAAHLMQQIDFETLILHGMLPLLLFAGAFLLDLEHLAKEKFTVSLLSIAGTTICFLLVAVLMHWLTAGHLSWLECFVFGALISPTDPIAVLEMLRRVGVSRRIEAQLAGESLFNDGIGAVLFLTMLAIARGNAPTPWAVGGLLIAKAGGAVAVGTIAAWLTSRFMRMLDSYKIDILFTVSLAFGGYVLADRLSLSAPLEAVVAGIALRHFNRRLPEDRIAHEQIDRFWEVIDEIQNCVLFVLLGLEAMAITLDANALRAGITAIGAVNVVRFGAIAFLLLIARLCQPEYKSSLFVLTWGGLRGGLSIALALSVPENLGRSWILGATYLVVVFSIVIQGGSMDWILRSRKTRRLAA
ncbi:cation:proton antiporter [Occallatibacter savannae]|uniref:cation:proton antiporter n=1 Tax=Occallatibacter savannae TaxID=1002691 RepID=UPI000D68BDA5|nr:sodium:proton antiporter [Occallatibacter savannae]